MQVSAIVLLAFSALAAAQSSGSASPTGVSPPSNGTIIAPTLTAPTSTFSGAAAGRREAGFGAIVIAVAGAVIVL